jgi:hypothetical protein
VTSYGQTDATEAATDTGIEIKKAQMESGWRPNADRSQGSRAVSGV